VCVCVCVCVCVENICRSRSNLVGENFDFSESADIGGQRFSECGLLKHT